MMVGSFLVCGSFSFYADMQPRRSVAGEEIMQQQGLRLEVRVAMPARHEAG
jgi:hypothetical protein